MHNFQGNLDYLIFATSLVCLYYWHFAINDFDDFNTFMILKLYSKYFYHWYHLILIIFWTNFATGLINVMLTDFNIFKHSSMNSKICLKWKILKFWKPIALTVNISFLVMLYTLWPNEWILIFKSFHFYYLYHHLLVCVLLILLWARYIKVESLNLLYVLSITLVIFLALIILSIIFKPPCTMNNHAVYLPRRPGVIAHRGAQYLSPENTIFSYHVAMNMCEYRYSNSNDDAGKLVALETDVQVSYDGTSFLLHDPYLYRTTNIRSKFPLLFRKFAYLFNFTLQLKLLNAGSWFLNKDPFSNAYRLPPQASALLSAENLPLFSEFLRLAKLYDKNIIFDAKFPEECVEMIEIIDWSKLHANCCSQKTLLPWSLNPRFKYLMNRSVFHNSFDCRHLAKKLCSCKHPYGPLLQQIILDNIDRSKISPNKVWWIADKRWDNLGVNPLIDKYPNFTYVFPLPIPITNLTRLGCRKLNLGNFKSQISDIKNYIRNNITINVYVVNQLWLFSYYWCVGVDSITTGRCGFMTNPSLRPLMLMNSSTYFALVSSMHLLCLLSMAIIFQFKISRINKQKDFVDLSKQA
ncbi:glycerophosphodiester phosphodiesterase domain-containing protein 5-like isoform X2 [Gordionus sp. m RMFG-2023]|uniref:glycerophosphodiester phosphodiesterase domain-containing protein 5-like isoform X2 n=1 Tax=Gordionus sp. m RMFG-2023 TaxID=3053472 RepID=UPI0031FE238A